MTSAPDLFPIDDEAAALLAHTRLMLDDPEIRARWPQTLADFLDIGAAALIRAGVPQDQALVWAAHVVIAQAHYRGGDHWYLPRGETLTTAVRNRLGFQRWFLGRATVADLKEEWGTTETRVFQIIAEQRELWRKRHAPQLPGMSDGD